MSKNTISPDNILLSSLNRVGDVVILSLIFFASCIPIFTIGASISAASYVSIKALSGEDGYITKRFIKSFKKNFKQATISWLIMLFAGIVLSADVYFWVNMWKTNHLVIAKPFIVISVILIFVYCMIFVHLFPLIGNYENTTKNTFKNALLIGLNKFPTTLILILLYFITVFILWDNVPLILIFIICGFGLVAYIMGFIHKNIFKSISIGSQIAKETIQNKKNSANNKTE